MLDNEGPTDFPLDFNGEYATLEGKEAGMVTEAEADAALMDALGDADAGQLTDILGNALAAEVLYNAVVDRLPFLGDHKVWTALKGRCPGCGECRGDDR